MANPFVGEIRLFGGNFAPLNWAFCDGSTLAISEFSTLFNLIGTTYGGDGQTNFCLPDLRGRVPVHQGQHQGISSVMGQTGGSETVTLTAAQMPPHSHLLSGSLAFATLGGPAGAALAATAANSYGPAPATVPMAAQAVGTQGGSQAHENMAPFTAINYIISLFGIYPSQS